MHLFIQHYAYHRPSGYKLMANTPRNIRRGQSSQGWSHCSRWLGSKAVEHSMLLIAHDCWVCTCQSSHLWDWRMRFADFTAAAIGVDCTSPTLRKWISAELGWIRWLDFGFSSINATWSSATCHFEISCHPLRIRSIFVWCRKEDVHDVSPTFSANHWCAANKPWSFWAVLPSYFLHKAHNSGQAP